MSVKYNKIFRLDDIMGNQLIDSFDTNSFDQSGDGIIIGGGGGGTGRDDYFPTSSLFFNLDLKLESNNKELGDKISFNVLGLTYKIGDTIPINTALIQDALTIEAITPLDIKATTQYVLVKKNLSVVAIEKYSNQSLVSSTDYNRYTNTVLNFELEKKVPIVPPTLISKSIQLETNYINDTVVEEIKFKITDNITKETNEYKVRDRLDTTSNNITISVEGFNKFAFKALYWQYANKFNPFSDLNYADFNKVTDKFFTLDQTKFTQNIIVFLETEPSSLEYPTLTLSKDSYEFTVNESILSSIDDSQVFDIDLEIKNTDYIKVVTPFRQFNVNLNAVNQRVVKLNLDLKRDFQNNIGTFKVILVPYSELFGDGEKREIILKLTKTLDIPIIDKIEYPNNLVVPANSLGNVNFDLFFESKLADYILIYVDEELDTNFLVKTAAKQTLTYNYNNLKSKFKNNKLQLLIVPYNETTGKLIKGEIERITINVIDSGVYISSDELKKAFFDAIYKNINLSLLDQNQKYLTHNASFDIDDKQILISNWETDFATFTKFKKDELGNDIPDGNINKSLVLKLYEPLPENISKNDLLWVSKIMALPVIQRVVVTSDSFDLGLPLRAPNFSIDTGLDNGNGTTYETFDNLILSGSETSQQIIDRYLSENFVDTDRITIDYKEFSNFVKYSSVVERLANFRYKKELSEFYHNKLTELSSSYFINPTILTKNEITSYEQKLSTLISGFDGWEKSLVSGSESFTIESASYASYPKDNNGFALNFSDANTISWYNGTLASASFYDKMNLNSLKNNIPQFVVNDASNSDYLLFLDMIGHYFDILYSYIKAMTEQRLIGEENTYGINDSLLYNYLESFSWDAKDLNNSKNLWNWLFGKDGNESLINKNDDDGYIITPEQYNKKIWRRIANNLPYLLKNKGTSRGIKALMACYGVPQSALTIIEFGGPAANQGSGSTFTYETQTSTLIFTTSSFLSASWTGSYGTKPECIEFRIKPKYDTTVELINGDEFELYISGGYIANSNTGIVNRDYGVIKLDVGGNTVIESEPYRIFDGNFHSLMLNKVDNQYTLYYGSADKDRIVYNKEETNVGTIGWNSGSQIVIGGFDGELDEFRIWKSALSKSVFDVHLVNSEAVIGNHLSASTEDLLIRLDFEYPKSLYPTGSIKNVAPINSYMAAVSASGFISASAYNSASQQHYNYRYINKDITVVLPNTGVTRYSNNKVRLETQELIADLSPKIRATKKAFDTAANDSNKLGLFFSPNKDLDLEIAKAIGGESIDDYFGNPNQAYDFRYKDLDNLRHYFFERVSNRNIYEFIQLIRYYDKSLFANIKQMLPARVKPATGLLIAPHFLERSKHKINRPIFEDVTLEGIVTDTQITELVSSYDTLETNLKINEYTDKIDGEKINLDGNLFANEIYSLTSSYDTTEGTITYNTTEISDAEYITYNGYIDYRRIDPTITSNYDLLNSNQIVGLNNFEDFGYGTYFNNGYSKYYYEENGVFKSKGIRGFIVTKTETIKQPIVTNRYRVDATPLIVSLPVNGGFVTYINENNTEFTLAIDEPKVYYFYANSIVTDGLIGCTLEKLEEEEILGTFTSSFKDLIICEVDFTGSLETDPLITNIITASGYLPNHYIYKKDSTLGRENLFYKGSKQTSYILNNVTGSFTTIDGKAAWEVFVTNPTTLRVSPQGRSISEPILEVD